jgi:hypothetical protein
MNWFQHDADSTQDAKIKKLLIRHGAIGYAVYFHCLELIIGDICETNITFELEHDSEIIADNLKIVGTGDKSGRDIVEEIMRTIVDLGLFTNENGHIFCFKLLKRINLSMTSNKALRDAIAIAKEKNHDSIMTHHDDIMIPTYLPTNPPTYQQGEQPEKRVPTLQEITDYIIAKQLVINPNDFLTYYENTGWKDRDGNPVKNWKNKLIQWNKREIDKRPGAKPYSPPVRQTQDVARCSCGGDISYGLCKACGKMYDGLGVEL